MRKKHIAIAFGIFVVFLLIIRTLRPEVEATEYIFTVSKSAEPADIREKLLEQEYMQGRWFTGLSMVLHGGYDDIQPGGYRVMDDMSTWALAAALTDDPPLKWVTIPEGFRKEQIADKLEEELGWEEGKRDRFLELELTTPYELTEGFYFPDTYLIPVDEAEAQVAKRFINRFNDNFLPYVETLRDANIKYDTAIKLASIIQREAGGKSDMPLIAGVLWNRLLIKMPLEVDATLQYARGDTGSGYWAPIAVVDKQIDSPFNTYMYPGLPPQPISNPGLDAIDAVLHSEETPCLFYLHDDDRQIYCAETYEGHLENIEMYLRN
jgi:UPF0755 protein